MLEVEKYKQHVRHILDAIEEGNHKKQLYKSEYEDGEVRHLHKLNYIYNEESGAAPDYSYSTYNSDFDKTIRLDIQSFDSLSFRSPEHSMLRIGLTGSIVFRFNPKTMDEIHVKLHSPEEMLLTTVKELLTEENYFMYSTLYNMPAYEEIQMLLVYMNRLRPELMRKRLQICGGFNKHVPDIGAYAFYQEVKTQ